jgi:hypothetical protein
MYQSNRLCYTNKKCILQVKFQITDIKFDYADDVGEDDCYFRDDIVGQIWDADDDNDLLKKITSASGWCVKKINYNIVK